MKKKRKKISLLLVVFVYILAVPEKESSIVKIIPSWNSPVSLHNDASFDTASLIPFRAGRYFGFFDKNGKFSLLREVFYNSTQSRNYFINYSNVSENLVLNKHDGSFVSNIRASGYPFFINERLFTVSHNSRIISEWNTQGDQLFSYESESEITSADANDNTFVAGFVDGTIIIVENGGKVEKLMKPEMSRINSVYGIAISEDSGHIAIISGIDPQYMMLMRKKNNQYIRVFTHRFDNNLRRARYIEYTGQDRYLAFENSNIFNCYDTLTGKIYESRFDGEIKNIHYIDEKGFFVIVTSGTGGDSEIHFVFPDGKRFYNKKIAFSDVFLESHNERLFLGNETAIYSADILSE